MKKYITVVYQFEIGEEVKDTVKMLKDGLLSGKISSMGAGDEMSKIDRLRELSEEGMSAWSEMMEVLFS